VLKDHIGTRVSVAGFILNIALNTVVYKEFCIRSQVQRFRVTVFSLTLLVGCENRNGSTGASAAPLNGYKILLTLITVMGKMILRRLS
jgi:hypothetical protein